MIPRPKRSHYDRTRLLLTVLIVLASIGLTIAGRVNQRARSTTAVAR